MHNHAKIEHSENQMESKQIPSPEHVVSIPFDIEDNISFDHNNFTRNSEEQNAFILANYSSDNDEINDYYITDTASPPSLPNEYETTQIQNYSRDTIIQEDVCNGWEKVDQDDKPDYGPFMATCGIKFDTDSCNPEDFFNNLFDNRIFTIIADTTNQYAHGKIRSILGNRDHFQQIEYHSRRRHARLSSWRDMNASDIKLFIVHLLVMSSIKKPALYSYWSTTSLSRTPLLVNT